MLERNARETCVMTSPTWTGCWEFEPRWTGDCILIYHLVVLAFALLSDVPFCFFLKLLFWYFQIFEKIISGMYLGEIVCRVLCRNVSVPCVKQSFYWIYTHSCCEDDRKCVLLWGLFFCWPTVSLYFTPSYLWFLCLYSSFLCFCYIGN